MAGSGDDITHYFGDGCPGGHREDDCLVGAYGGEVTRAAEHPERYDAMAAIRHALPVGTVVTPLEDHPDGFTLSVRLPEV